MTETTATYASERVRDCVRRASGLVQTRLSRKCRDRCSERIVSYPEVIRVDGVVPMVPLLVVIGGRAVQIGPVISGRDTRPSTGSPLHVMLRTLWASLFLPH